MDIKIKQHKCGFYSVVNMPAEEELAKFYQQKYFQENKGNYQKVYHKTECIYIENKAKVAEWLCAKLNIDGYRLFDIGCGEGYFAKYFYNKKYQVFTSDFSKFAVSWHNPELLDLFTQGDIYKIIKDNIENKEKYHFINLTNVLEHVIHPAKLLKDVQKLLFSTSSLLRIIVPNDFSLFQKMLLEKKFSDNTWLSPPEHLHYFNIQSLTKLLKFLGFKIKLLMTDFPIEQYLVNPHSNYVKNQAKGKQAHQARMVIDNFMFKQGIENYVNYYKSCARVNMGRVIIIYASRIK